MDDCYDMSTLYCGVRLTVILAADQYWGHWLMVVKSASIGAEEKSVEI